MPLFIIAFIILMGILGPFVVPNSPYETSLTNRLRPPFWQEGGSISYPLGTDVVGRDVLSRVIVGSRISLIVGVLAITLGAVVGLVVGLTSGYLGGRIDTILMRVTDVFLSFPMILLALLLAVTMGSSLLTTVLAIGLLVWARYARLIRGEVLSVRRKDYVTQARIAGLSSLRIVLRHILPNVTNTVVVIASLQLGWAILMEATLSFLGAGIPPPEPTWGSMISEGRGYVTKAYWLSLWPGLAVMMTVLAFNLFGDWLRDTLDPKLRQA